MNNLAPIVLFTYNRLWHTQQTIEALQKNELAKESELFIYNDGGKDEESWQKVNEVRDYLKTINGFKNIIITEQEKNLGLASSIISGVTSLINKYDKIIVLEDDMITSKYFLTYMNESLNFYEKEEKVWHIGGYVPNIDFQKPVHYFFNRTMYCWGWATWKNRWKYFSNSFNSIDAKLNKDLIFSMNLDGINQGVYKQYIANKEERIKTWAIFWYINIFLNNGLCLIPTLSFVHNIGNDNSGTNCLKSNKFDIHLNKEYHNKFPTKIEEESYFLEKLKLFYKG